MLSTLQLVLALGLGRSALVADGVLTATGLALSAVVVIRARARRTRPPVSAAEIVAEAEAVVTGAGDRQPV